jgi:hypothetical protein
MTGKVISESEEVKESKVNKSQHVTTETKNWKKINQFKLEHQLKEYKLIITIKKLEGQTISLTETRRK